MDNAARAVLVGLNLDKKPEEYAYSMKELEGLAKALGLSVESSLVQNAKTVTQKTYIGSGKVEELKVEIAITDADLVIFNESLTPMQVRNLEEILDTEVLDRTGIILQIFSERAKTREARLQVEIARLQYLLPRLAGMRKNLSRQGGGSGRLSNKGAGEEKLELDRRHIEHRIAELSDQLKDVERERGTQRSRRLDSGLPCISLVGYTNAGKSSLMNALLARSAGDNTEKSVFEEDMLFATLDTSVRRIQVPGHKTFLLTDTVGFVSDLPHTLVKAFRSTLDETKYADLLLMVLDCHDPAVDTERLVTMKTLEEIGAGKIPSILVYNKGDLAEEERIPRIQGDKIYLSAKTGVGLEELLGMIDSWLEEQYREMDVVLPYSEGSLLHELQEKYAALIDYQPEGVRVRAKVSLRDAGRIDAALNRAKA